MKRNTSRKAEEAYLAETLRVVRDNVREYGQEVAKMQEDIDEMLEHYHDNDTEVLTILNNTVTMHTHMTVAYTHLHGAVAFGHYGKALYEVFKYIGVPVEDLNFNQPKGMMYPTENPFA